VAELTYPSFPVRALVALAAALVVLVPVAIAQNESGPSEHGCAVAAEHVMVAQGYTAAMMALIGTGPVRACRGLSRQQYAQALLDTYQIEYGRFLSRQPMPRDMPPPAVKARSARAGAQSH
jgi:hypothetical protein